MRNLHSLRSSDSNISMNHGMKKMRGNGLNIWLTRQEKLISRNTWGNVLHSTRSSMGEKISKDLESVFTVNHNNVTYQYINRNISVNKLFCMYANADCLSNKLNELKSVIDSCDTHPHLIDFCEIKPQNFLFTPSASDFSMLGHSLFHSNINTQDGRGVSLYISNILDATPIVLCDEFCESV